MNEKLDLRKVEYSKNDLRLGIKVPEYLTEELAYFIGYHVGDGYMKIVRRGKAVDYRLVYDGHSINQYLEYWEVIKPLIKKLFNKEVIPKKTKTGTVTIYFCSKAILTFLHYCCCITLSPKKSIDVPITIKNSTLRMKSHFIRGLADTDFSLMFKRRGTYPQINHATCSRNLHESLKVLLQEFRFSFYFATYHRERKGTKTISYQIDISGKKNLQKWMEIIGCASYNTLTRYQVWKETGSLSPRTDINERIKILKERGITPLQVTPQM